MKVAINAAFFRPKDIGGSGIYVEKLARHLLSIDDSVELVIFAPPDALDRFGESLRVEKVQLPKAEKFQFRIYYEQVFIPKRSEKSRADVIISPGTSGPFKSSIPHVSVVNDLQHRYYPSFFSFRSRAFRKIFWEGAVKRADAIIAISEFTRNDLIKLLGVEAQRIHTVYHGTDISEPSREALEEMARRIPRPFIFLPARTYPHKGHVALIRAFEKIADSIPHHLIFCGSPDVAHDGVMSAIKASPYKGRILHVGSLSHQEVLALYRLCDLLVFPSEFEGFGLPLLEAMAAGCPVVATNVSSIPEVCGDAAILVPPKDLQALADGILLALNDSELRRTLIERGKTRAKEFSWERCAKQTLDVLRQVVSSSRAQAKSAGG